jgi:integrase
VITDAWLKAHHGSSREKVEEHGDRDGLGIRVSSKGKIVFQMRYRFEGKAHRLDLGSYAKMTLKAAREENQRLRGKLEQGHDPKVVRLVARRTIRASETDTLNRLFADWYEKYAAKTKPAHREIRRSFEIHVLPRYGALPASEVGLNLWLELLEGLVPTVPTIADRILTNAKQMLKWAVRRQRLKVNPLSEITAKQDLLIVNNVSTRSLNEEELRRVWNAIDQSHVRPRNKLFLKLCVIYGCRHTELRKAHKNHFDLANKVWIIPPEHHKTGKRTKKPLLRPITPEIEPLVREALAWATDCELLFTRGYSTEAKGSQSQISLPINLCNWLEKNDSYKMPAWTVKALRKTARTNFSTLAPPHVAEIMLGHALPGSWAIYDQHDYLKEQAAAYSAWCRRIMSLIGADNLLGADQWPKLATFRPKATFPPAAAARNGMNPLSARSSD